LSKLEGYQEVADRIAAFYEKYPEGSIRTKGFNVIEVAGLTFIVVEALVYRNTQDRLPGTGTAWEQFPARSPMLRGSELMVGETSAWGRALASIGLGGKKIATAEEVQAAVEVKASDRGLKLQAELKKRKVTQDTIKLAMAACGVDVGGRSLPVVFKSLTDEEVNALWHRLISE
jgi:hypothetical protein